MRTRDVVTFVTLTLLVCVLFSVTVATAGRKIVGLNGEVRNLNFSKSVPGQLNYQGFLADAADSSAVTATLEMTFRLFDSETKGAELWSETHSAVEVSNGLFQVLLGSVTPFPDGLFDGNTLWLQTEVGTEALSPRRPLASVAYSHRTNSAEMLEDNTLTDLDNRWVNEADLDHLDAADGDPAEALYVDDAGKVGIGTTSPLTELDVSGSVNATTYYGDGSNLTGIAGTPDADWTIDGNDVYHETGNVGIGTTSPSHPLEVNGAVGATTYYGDGSNLTGISGTTDNDWTISGNDIYSSMPGNVGIGTTAPAEKLHVVGNLRASGTIQSGSSITIDGVNNRVTSSADLSLHVISGRALRLDPHATSPNLIGGYSGNSVNEGIYGATIGGGGNSGSINSVTGNYSTVAGGQGNTASSDRAFVGGGQDNTVSSSFATVGGGWDNQASNPYAFAGGGSNNRASGQYAAVGGGSQNVASGNYATITGGDNNTAAGDYSFAAGRRAKANHSGTFVWGDGTDADFASTGANQFLIRASGGVGIGTSNPQRLLHLVGANPRILIEASSISPEVNFKNSDDAGPEVWALYKHGTTDDFRFYQNGDKVTIQKGTGYVGIGTTNPISQLHIKETSFPTYLTVESDAGYAPGIILNVNGTNEWRMLYHPADSILTFWREGLGEQMVINNDGFVGIGTIDPSTKLHVKGQSNPWSAILYAESLQELGFTLNGVAIHGYQSGADVGGIGVMGEASGMGVGEIGVYGYASSTSDSAVGVCGKTDSPSGYGVYYIGGLGGKGAKSSVVNTEDYGWRHLYSMESTGNWFEDFGQAQLAHGEAVVAIDPIFSQTVNLNEMPYHVFLTPLGDCGLYVSEKSSASFTVRALDGRKEDIRFDYRIVAKRREYEHKRLEPAMDPDKFIQKANQLSKRS